MREQLQRFVSSFYNKLYWTLKRFIAFGLDLLHLLCERNQIFVNKTNTHLSIRTDNQYLAHKNHLPTNQTNCTASFCALDLNLTYP